jgi:N-acyl homoserine lactone hydrolase
MFTVGGYEIDILVHGYPGKSVCHGGLGWSTIVLLRGHSRIALVDAGGFGIRKTLIGHLESRGLKPDDITDLLLTHSHYDHSVNWTLFKHACITIGAVEMAWALKEPWGETPVPELYVERLETWPTLALLAHGSEAMPCISAHLGSGHTPGCLVYRLEADERDVIFTGDAAKNRAELVSRATDMTYDAAVSGATIEKIWELWQRKPGTIVVPGHDLPMHLGDGVPCFIGEREAGITSWLADDMDTTTLFKLTA